MTPDRFAPLIEIAELHHARDLADLGRIRSEAVRLDGRIADLRRNPDGLDAPDGSLATARAAHPEATILYKPHPDVEAGLRDGGAEAGHLADRVVAGLPPKMKQPAS